MDRWFRGSLVKGKIQWVASAPPDPLPNQSVTLKNDLKIANDSKELQEGDLGDPALGTESKVRGGLGRCPREWFIDGREPNNWREHMKKVATEAAAIAAELRRHFTKILMEGTFEQALRHPLLGEKVLPMPERLRKPRKRAK